jgi:hypothetical protein
MVDAMESASSSSISRRKFILGAGGAGVLAAAPIGFMAAEVAGAAPADAATSTPNGTPEQIHLTWGVDPARNVVVSWVTTGQAVTPRVSYGLSPDRGTVVDAVQNIYTDGLNGRTVFAYDAVLTGLQPGSEYHYAVTANNDPHAAHPFVSTFRTPEAGRQSFRFTSFGDLATPDTQWVLSYGQAAYAVAAVESFEPLFHLLNGDLCYGNLNPTSQPEVWRSFGINNQRSAARRPWMPCIGNHELEFENSSQYGQDSQKIGQGLDSYLTRYRLPDNGVAGFAGRWYTFRVGSVVFISLDADDVVYQDASAFNAGPDPLVPAASTSNKPIPAGTSLYVRGYSDHAQTAWLERTLKAARADTAVDWIVVQMHQDACSSSAIGNGSDLGIREAWLPLFDQYEVDLVVCGHDHDYERSWPVRGADSMVGTEVATGEPVQTLRPRPVMAAVDGSTYDTSQGTVHLILGGGGTDAPLDDFGIDAGDGSPQAKVFTKANRPQLTTTAGVYARAQADAVEDAVWSANRDSGTGYGIAVFDVDPGTAPGAQTTITVSYFHAPGADPTNPTTGATGTPNSDYSLLETFTLARSRRDG